MKRTHTRARARAIYFNLPCIAPINFSLTLRECMILFKYEFFSSKAFFQARWKNWNKIFSSFAILILRDVAKCLIWFQFDCHVLHRFFFQYFVYIPIASLMRGMTWNWTRLSQVVPLSDEVNVHETYSSRTRRQSESQVRKEFFLFILTFFIILVNTTQLAQFTERCLSAIHTVTNINLKRPFWSVNTRE